MPRSVRPPRPPGPTHLEPEIMQARRSFAAGPRSAISALQESSRGVFAERRRCGRGAASVSRLRRSCEPPQGRGAACACRKLCGSMSTASRRLAGCFGARPSHAKKMRAGAASASRLLWSCETAAGPGRCLRLQKALRVDVHRQPQVRGRFPRQAQPCEEDAGGALHRPAACSGHAKPPQSRGAACAYRKLCGSMSTASRRFVGGFGARPSHCEIAPCKGACRGARISIRTR
ncbi:hypothetical protein SAMN04244548_00717 [Paracoccus pantotrophus]|nr:hypothetical protein SAMN04244548_00717 [Paracoccus pantotrophus]